MQPSRDQWVATIGDALTYAAAHSDVEADRLGLLGFSLGGYVTLRAAKRPSGNAVKAAVSFFAPIHMPPFGGIGGDIDKLPPLRIHLLRRRRTARAVPAEAGPRRMLVAAATKGPRLRDLFL